MSGPVMSAPVASCRDAAPPTHETWRSWLVSFFVAPVQSSDSRADPALDEPDSRQVPPVAPLSSEWCKPLRRTWSECDTVRMEDLDDCPGGPSPAERLFCEQRRQSLGALDEATQGLIREIFGIITGEDEEADRADDETFIECHPGYEKTAEQRCADCARVAAILRSAGRACEPSRVLGVHANLTWLYGETLLWMAIEYDHRHQPEMMDVLLQAGADPNLPNAVDGLRPLQNPWLDLEEMAPEGAACASLIRIKRERLTAGGADARVCRLPQSSVEQQQQQRQEARGGRNRLRGCERSAERAPLGRPAARCEGAFSRSQSSLW